MLIGLQGMGSSAPAPTCNGPASVGECRTGVTPKSSLDASLLEFEKRRLTALPGLRKISGMVPTRVGRVGATMPAVLHAEE